MPKKSEKITLTDEQLKVLNGLGIDFKGKELSVSLLAGRIPIIRDMAEMEEEIIICVSGC
jgi:hypothetical protein